MANWRVEDLPSPLGEIPSDNETEITITTPSVLNENEKIEVNSVSSLGEEKYLKVTGITHLISVFDGQNISVNSFIRECKKAEGLVDPRDRALLFRLILSKVKGNADAYLENHKITNLPDLFSVLKRAYDPSRSISEIQIELNSVAQTPEETVFEYGNRVTQLTNKLLESIRDGFRTTHTTP